MGNIKSGNVGRRLVCNFVQHQLALVFEKEINSSYFAKIK